jgi:hypothetical protein
MVIIYSLLFLEDWSRALGEFKTRRFSFLSGEVEGENHGRIQSFFIQWFTAMQKSYFYHNNPLSFDELFPESKIKR